MAEEEEQKPAQQTAANGSAVQKAPAPDAKGMLTAKTLSIADQLATGLLTAGEHLQAGSLPYCAFRCPALCAHQDPPSMPFVVMLAKAHQAPCLLGLLDVMPFMLASIAYPAKGAGKSAPALRCLSCCSTATPNTICCSFDCDADRRSHLLSSTMPLKLPGQWLNLMCFTGQGRALRAGQRGIEEADWKPCLVFIPTPAVQQVICAAGRNIWA